MLVQALYKNIHNLLKYSLSIVTVFNICFILQSLNGQNSTFVVLELKIGIAVIAMLRTVMNLFPYFMLVYH